MEKRAGGMRDLMEDAVAALVAGNLVAFPTETVYGLGADATNERAITRIFEAKGRPADHPLIVHLAEGIGLDEWARAIPEYAKALAAQLWPGPMTLILPKAERVSSLLTGGQDTVGLRVPSHPLAQDLLSRFAAAGGSAVAAPSANRFGRVSPTTAAAVLEELDSTLCLGDRVLDGGACTIGVESTIIDCTGAAPSIARPGAISADMIYRATDIKPTPFLSQIRVSGALESHYAPQARVVIDDEANPGDGFIALSDHPTPPGAIRLVQAKTVEEFAQQLYGGLRKGDNLGIARIVALAPDGEGFAEAVRDRLHRASSQKKSGKTTSPN